MELEEKIIKVKREEEIPTLQELNSIPRGLNLKLIFEEETIFLVEQIEANWKKELPGFSIGVQTNGIEINIHKLITNKEIEEHQLFFEKCAIEYGILGESLINQFMDTFQVKPHEGIPLRTLNPYRNTPHPQGGDMGSWKYFFHGHHCAFTNKETGQHIEVPLTFGEEYGVLDPYFFSQFIVTSLEFRPLPIEIYNYFGDGNRILDVMLKLERFEEIHSNFRTWKGVIVKNRNKKMVRIFENGMDVFINEVMFKNKKWSLWRRVKLKIAKMLSLDKV